nr:nicotinate-nucleotide diphosphorylase (carboxylating) [Bacteroidia bacterium]
MNIQEFIKLSLQEDIGTGDHTSLACIPGGSKGKARLLVKDTGVIAGVAVAEDIFRTVDPSLTFTKLISDGTIVNHGDFAFTVEGDDQSILKSERIVLNCMQRMSGIATLTKQYTD